MFRILTPALLGLTLAVAPVAGHADENAPLADQLEKFEREADELSEQALKTVEDFIKLLEPMLDRLSFFIDDLPSYHAPETLPNGDIIIRRKREGEKLPTPGTATDGATDT